jgi:hypothetical protein
MREMKHLSGALAVGVLCTLAWWSPPLKSEPWPERTVRVILPAARWQRDGHRSTPICARSRRAMGEAGDH